MVQTLELEKRCLLTQPLRAIDSVLAAGESRGPGQ